MSFATEPVYITFHKTAKLSTSSAINLGRRMLADNYDLWVVIITRQANAFDVVVTLTKQANGEVTEEFEVSPVGEATKQGD